MTRVPLRPGEASSWSILFTPARGGGFLVTLAFATFALFPIRAQEPPVIPVGLDCYRLWDHWADQRIGQRAYMRSTFDRTGGNNGSDAGNYLFQPSDDASVPLDVE